ncbi:MAG TPA: T9SS type A sorting domain-containing protein [Flavitalea sp.]|nr:T9SS type A sorting domain-containing protein [Flavitalea sp.]
MFRTITLICLQLAALASAGQFVTADLTSSQIFRDTSSVISSLSAIIKDQHRIVLSWKINDPNAPEFFTVERSTNGKEFEVVSVVRVALFNEKFEYTDEAGTRGKSMYRLRAVWKDGTEVYSKPVPVQIESSSSIKFYPNPVDNILIIRTDQPIDVQISDATGKSRISFNKVQGLQTVNVSTLEKGIYLLRITNKLTNSVIQDKLIKN